jgi:hypothetical protein
MKGWLRVVPPQDMDSTPATHSIKIIYIINIIDEIIDVAIRPYLNVSYVKKMRRRHWGFAGILI